MMRRFRSLAAGLAVAGGLALGAPARAAVPDDGHLDFAARDAGWRGALLARGLSLGLAAGPSLLRGWTAPAGLAGADGGPSVAFPVALEGRLWAGRFGLSASVACAERVSGRAGDPAWPGAAAYTSPEEFAYHYYLAHAGYSVSWTRWHVAVAALWRAPLAPDLALVARAGLLHELVAWSATAAGGTDSGLVGRLGSLNPLGGAGVEWHALENVSFSAELVFRTWRTGVGAERFTQAALALGVHWWLK